MDAIPMLLNLGAVAAIAVGAVLLLWRVSERASPPRSRVVVGYPPDLFPVHDIVSSAPLAALAETQARLLSLHEQLPVGSDSARRIDAFLLELRAIMDLAYRVATATRAYGLPRQLDRLVSEVQQIERQLAEQVVNRLLSYEADEQEELLGNRMTALQSCVRDLALSADAQVPLR